MSARLTEEQEWFDLLTEVADGINRDDEPSPWDRLIADRAAILESERDLLVRIGEAGGYIEKLQDRAERAEVSERDLLAALEAALPYFRGGGLPQERVARIDEAIAAIANARKQDAP